MKKDKNVLIKTWTNFRDESIFVINEFNKKVMKMKKFINEYNNRIDELNDSKLIIHELKVKLWEKNVFKNSNTSLFIIESAITIAIFKKLFNSLVFIDDENSFINDWFSVMHNKLKENANWFSINVQQKTYVRIKIDENVIKYLISRFFKNSIKSYITAKEIFDDLCQIFDDSNRRINVLKDYRRLKQVESFKNFNTF